MLAFDHDKYTHAHTHNTQGGPKK